MESFYSLPIYIVYLHAFLLSADLFQNQLFQNYTVSVKQVWDPDKALNFDRAHRSLKILTTIVIRDLKFDDNKVLMIYPWSFN